MAPSRRSSKTKTSAPKKPIEKKIATSFGWTKDVVFDEAAPKRGGATFTAKPIPQSFNEYMKKLYAAICTFYRSQGIDAIPDELFLEIKPYSKAPMAKRAYGQDGDIIIGEVSNIAFPGQSFAFSKKFLDSLDFGSVSKTSSSGKPYTREYSTVLFYFNTAMEEWAKQVLEFDTQNPDDDSKCPCSQLIAFNIETGFQPRLRGEEWKYYPWDPVRLDSDLPTFIREMCKGRVAPGRKGVEESSNDESEGTPSGEYST